MVAIVSGIRTGLNLTSAEVLGFRDVIGGDLQGRKGQGVNVNIALGQLVLQDQDDLLVARGNDAPVVRTYDARGNLRDVADGRAHVTMEYDLVGNRTRVGTYVNYQGVAGETASGSDLYFKYDEMNRQTVADAADAAGTNLGALGHRITYDHDGNRTSDTSIGKKVVAGTSTPVIIDYNADGTAIYTPTEVTYSVSEGESREEYRYDALNRLTSVVRDGVQIDVRHYDGADRVIQSGPGGNLPAKYAELINQGIPAGQTNGKETRLNRYDANGRLMHQTVLKSDNTLKLNISWDVNETASDLGITFRPAGYDAAGNVVGYTVTNHEAGVINNYTSTLARFDGYQAANTRGESTKQLPGDSTQQYDANGFLVGIVDSTQPANNRSFVNDASGKALFVNQAGNVQRQLIVNGEVLGLYGAGVDPNAPASGYNNNPNFANVVDFDFGYARISANHPSASPGAYTVRTGDTLQSISQSAYGDSALWYRIAEANGLASNNDLRVGQTLNIPNRVSTINNNSTTFKPYDPSRIEGDKTPSLATPEPKKKSGSWLGKLLMVIVAIVVTIYTAGAMAAAMGAVSTGTSTFAAGMASLAGGSFGTTALTAGALGSISATAVASSAIGAAVGSIASQGIGMATGVQDEFSWRGVGLSALSGGATAGLGGTGFIAGSNIASVAARAAVASVATQGIGVATGLQQKFDWRGVAASAVGAGAGQAVAPAMANVFGLESFGQRLATGLIAGTTAAVMRGGKIVVQQVAVDAFGSAVGQSVADVATSDKRRATEAVQLSDVVYGGADAPPAPYTGEGIERGRMLGLKVSQQTLANWSAGVDRSIAAAPDSISDALQALYDERHPPLPEYLPIADNSANPPLVQRPSASKPGFWSGVASTAATMIFGGDNPARITPQEREAWRREHPNPAFGELPTIRYDIDLGQRAINRVIDSTPPVSEQLKDIFSLGFRAVGHGLGTFAGGLRVAGDETLSSDVRNQGAYDAGASSLSVPAAWVGAGAPGLRIRSWVMGPNDGPRLPKWGGPTDYSLISDPPNSGMSSRVTPRQRREMMETNRTNNGGVLRDDVTGEFGIPALRSTRGVTPRQNEIQVDHIKPVDAGGTREQSNLQLRLRIHNRAKSNRWDGG